MFRSANWFWISLIGRSFPGITRDEKITPGKAAGIVLGFGGVALLLADELAPGLGGPVAAKLAVLGASASYAFAAVFAKRFRGIDRATTGSLSLLPGRPWEDEE